MAVIIVKWENDEDDSVFFKIDTLRLLTKYLLTQALIMACYELIRSHKYYEGALGDTHRILCMFTLQKRALSLRIRPHRDSGLHSYETRDGENTKSDSTGQ